MSFSGDFRKDWILAFKTRGSRLPSLLFLGPYWFISATVNQAQQVKATSARNNCKRKTKGLSGPGHPCGG